MLAMILYMGREVMIKKNVTTISLILMMAIIGGCSAKNKSVSSADMIVSEVNIEGEIDDAAETDMYNKSFAQIERLDDYLKNVRPYGIFIKNDVIGLLIEDYDANTIVLTDGKGNVLNKIEIPFSRSVYYENCEVYDEGIVLHGKNNNVCFFDISTMELMNIEIPEDITTKIDVHSSFTYLPKKDAIAYATEDGGLYVYENGQELLLYQGDISNPDSFIPYEVKGTYNQKKLMLCGYINDTNPKTGYCYKCTGLYDLETQKMEWKKNDNERMISTSNADIFCMSYGGSIIQGDRIGEVYTLLQAEEFGAEMDIISAESIVDYIPAQESFLCARKLEGGDVYMIDREGNRKSVDIGYDCPDLVATNEDGSLIAGTAIVYDDKKENFTSVLYLKKLGEKND